MIKTIINIQGMTCAHCVKAVTDALKEIPLVTDVIVDLNSKTATVTHDNGSTQQMVDAIIEEGYEVIAVN